MYKKQDMMTIHEIHSELFDVLVEVDRLFDKYKIPYCLIFGSLLGCVRDNGFIPWDDDIDICVMPEYWEKANKVLGRYLNKEKFFLINKYTRKQYPRWAKITRVGVNGTVRNMDYYKENVDYKSGIFIDVFRMVYCPNNKYISLLWEYLIGFLDAIINLKTLVNNEVTGKYIGAYILYHLGVKKCSVYELNKIREKVQCFFNNKKTDYITVPSGSLGVYTLDKSKYEKKWFAQFIKHDFYVYDNSGSVVKVASFPIPANYEDILKKTYGNWKRKPRNVKTKNLSYWSR